MSVREYKLGQARAQEGGLHFGEILSAEHCTEGHEERNPGRLVLKEFDFANH